MRDLLVHDWPVAQTTGVISEQEGRQILDVLFLLAILIVAIKKRYDKLAPYYIR
jgi:hypothetical protein